MERRVFLLGSMAATAASAAPTPTGKADLYGLIGKMKAVAGQREALIPIVLEGAEGMPGCLSYIVARDVEDADAIWITEVWESEASHDASLQLPSVQAAVAKARDLVAGVETGVATVPVGGIGLKR
ncbi:putative quinol monooxygenase [Sphingomonas sp. PR090111-T3T-6A]|uniref:putative quinol monooxygenase n=1 Tax=Sphingomonas sp. PR090111-T3T-6A TaxID=685778 RepID=UPI0004767DF2|nr:putative quinol monooxygenase [Sphingomonas sp. PR090111-T3T-6A]